MVSGDNERQRQFAIDWAYTTEARYCTQKSITRKSITRMGHTQAPAVVEPAAVRSATYMKGLEMAHFDRSKYVDVHQRSPALGSTLGSNYGNETLCAHKDSQGLRVNRRLVRANLKALICVRGTYIEAKPGNRLYAVPPSSDLCHTRATWSGLRGEMRSPLGENADEGGCRTRHYVYRKFVRRDSSWHDDPVLLELHFR